MTRLRRRFSLGLLLGVIVLGVALLPGCAREMFVVWDRSGGERWDPRRFLAVAYPIDPTSDLNRFVLVRVSEWTSDEGDIDVLVGGVQTPMSRDAFSIDLSALSDERLASLTAGLNGAIAHWGADTDWVHVGVSVEHRTSDADPVTCIVDVLAVSSKRTRYTYVVDGNELVPTRVEARSLGAAFGSALIGILVVGAVGLLVSGVVVWLIWSRLRRAGRGSVVGIDASEAARQLPVGGRGPNSR